MELTAILVRLAGQQSLGIHFSVSPMLEFETFTVFLSSFYMGISDPNSGPYDCTVITLPSESFFISLSLYSIHSVHAHHLKLFGDSLRWSFIYARLASYNFVAEDELELFGQESYWLSLAEGQAFKYTDLKGPFSFKPPYLATEVLRILCSILQMRTVLI